MFISNETGNGGGTVCRGIAFDIRRSSARTQSLAILMIALFFFIFFANACAQSFYRPSPIRGQRVLYTGGPHGLLSCFITDVLPGIFWFFKLQAGPSVTPIVKEW